MKLRTLPSIPTRLLRYFCPGTINEAVIGDLIEQYESGKSSLWYWRQAASIAGSSLRRRAIHRLPEISNRIFSEDGLVVLVGIGALFAAGPFALAAIPAGFLIWCLWFLNVRWDAPFPKNVIAPRAGPATAAINSAKITIDGGLGAGFLILILLCGLLIELPGLRMLVIPGLLSGLAYAALLHWWRSANPRDPERDWISIKPK
jgi:hypothetical protein